jgi:hypothetical protein
MVSHETRRLVLWMCTYNIKQLKRKLRSIYRMDVIDGYIGVKKRWVAQERLSAEHAIDTGFGHHGVSVSAATAVAVAKHRHPNSGLDSSDLVPISAMFSCVGLGACAAMDGDEAGACALEHLGVLDSGESGVEAADLDGGGNEGEGVVEGAEKMINVVGVFHK